MTATQILSEQAAQEAVAKLTMEYNAATTEKMIRMILHYMKSIPKGNKTPVHMIEGDRRTVTPGGNSIIDKKRTFTLGDVGELLRQKGVDVFYRINSKSGSVPSNYIRKLELKEILAHAEAGSPIAKRAFKEMTAMGGMDPTEEEIEESVPRALPQGGGQPPQSAEMSALDPQSALQKLDPRSAANRAGAGVRGLTA